jgi:DnaJ-class molecular chaperone
VTCPHCLGAGELEIAPEKTHHGIAYMRCLSCNGRGVLEEPIVWTEAERADFEQTMQARGILREDNQ